MSLCEAIDHSSKPLPVFCGCSNEVSTNQKSRLESDIYPCSDSDMQNTSMSIRILARCHLFSHDPRTIITHVLGVTQTQYLSEGKKNIKENEGEDLNNILV